MVHKIGQNFAATNYTKMNNGPTGPMRNRTLRPESSFGKKGPSFPFPIVRGGEVETLVPRTKIKRGSQVVTNLFRGRKWIAPRKLN